MVNHDRWRDQQLRSFSNFSGGILPQEKVLLDFVTQYKDISWQWAGTNTSFKQICNQHVTLTTDNKSPGLIMFGPGLFSKTTSQLLNILSPAIKNKQYVYVAINRYEIIQHDLPFELPDNIADSIDVIMNYCDPGFFRLHTFNKVDGNHMVAAHPMDCYGLCR